MERVPARADYGEEARGFPPFVGAVDGEKEAVEEGGGAVFEEGGGEGVAVGAPELDAFDGAEENGGVAEGHGVGEAVEEDFGAGEEAAEVVGFAPEDSVDLREGQGGEDLSVESVELETELGFGFTVDSGGGDEVEGALS